MASPPSRRQDFLPPKSCLRLKSVEFQEELISVRASAGSITGSCPSCQRSSQAIHSRYWRVLRDLPSQGKAVELHVEVRRFRCRDRDCLRKTFVEQVPTVTVRRGQQTLRFSETVRIVGYSLGGEAGFRLAKRLGINTSPDTVLRRIKQGNVPESELPKFVGVDDWAWRKGQRYGSILVDLESRRPIDLLPDRSGDTFAAWLKQHPSVQLIIRDRAEAYADGAKRGAPEAIQVADRFHLLCNLTSAAERVLESKRTELSRASEPEEPKPEQPVPAKASTPRKSPAEKRSQDRRECRLERYDQVIELHRQGMNQRAIGRTLHIGRKTVRRFLRSGQFPERATPRRKPPGVNKFRDYLEKRWAEGCHNATKLWREIRTQGYAGGRSMVAKLVSTFRTPNTQNNRKCNQQCMPKAKRKSLSPRQAAMLLARHPEKLTDAEQQLIARIEKCCPAAALLHPLINDFSAVLRNKDPGALQPWIESANASGLPAIKTFSDGLLRDHAAVTAAISLNWSNGQVEGQVHRLKLIKRQMYGRASFDLLRSRVLPYTPLASQLGQRAP
jgi:transposase